MKENIHVAGSAATHGVPYFRDRVAQADAPPVLRLRATYVGVPAVAVPTGLAAGLPQGVQVVAGMYREDLCLEAAQRIEERLGVLTPLAPRPHRFDGVAG